MVASDFSDERAVPFGASAAARTTSQRAPSPSTS